MKACIDSDVIIDYFDGRPKAAEEFGRYESILISRISWMEVLIGVDDSELREVREEFLRLFRIVELDEAVAREAIGLRKKHRLKLPDAIVWAGARLNDAILVTRNSKDFRSSDPSIRIPYRL